MWGGGYNVSREVLLAIRQGNEKRVEHLVAGLVASLRTQREVSSSEYAVATSHDWGPDVSLGTSPWDFACAVQRLSRMPLGSQRESFWDEVSAFVTAYSSKLSSREIAVFCSAYAAGAPEKLAGALAQDLGKQAASRANELNAKDLSMILHALARSTSLRNQANGNAQRAGIKFCTLRSLAQAAMQVRLDERRPQQAALLLNAFVRLQYTRDAALFGKYFGFAVKTIHVWDSQALSLFCNAFASVDEVARKHIRDGGWRIVADRCSNVLLGADGQHLACMAHALVRVAATPEEVEDFYTILEQVLCKRPNANDILSAQDVALIAHGLALHKRPGEAFYIEDKDPVTEWKFEEYAARRMRDLTLQGLTSVLIASVRLRRGGMPFFFAIASEMRRRRQKLSGPGLGIALGAVLYSSTVVGLRHSLDLMRDLQKTMISVMPELKTSDIITAGRAVAAAATALSLEGSGLAVWSSPTSAQNFLEALCERARKEGIQTKTIVHTHVVCIARVESVSISETIATLQRKETEEIAELQEGWMSDERAKVASMADALSKIAEAELKRVDPREDEELK